MSRKVCLVRKNNKKERAIGQGRKTREEIGKGNQTTALVFHTVECFRWGWGGGVGDGGVSPPTSLQEPNKQNNQKKKKTCLFRKLDASFATVRQIPVYI